MSDPDNHVKNTAPLGAANRSTTRAPAAPVLAGVFLLLVLIFAATRTTGGPLTVYVIAAAVAAGYMALFVGANDVANNVGPAVGGRALTLGAALAIAAVFEAAGAIIAGGDVVTTISQNIIRPDPSMAAADFVVVMLAGLVAAAMSVHLATRLGIPVSTTHAIVGGVLGAGVAASGIEIVSWPTIGAIAASWIIAPLMGGVIAAGLFLLVKALILDRAATFDAARRWLPMLVAAMAGVFSIYLTIKGLSHVWTPGWKTIALIGAAFFLGTWLMARPWVERRSRRGESRGTPVTALFILPLVVAAALLCFAHGANDVANAVGPLAAIVAAADAGLAAPQSVRLPLWGLLIGGIGLSVGLTLFGPTVIRTVGEKITKINPARAYCVALSVATTVLVASAFGLPVSSTHIAVGAVFGVGVMREAMTNIPSLAVQPRTRFLNVAALNATPEDAIRRVRRRERRRLVRRRYGVMIAAAWVITVPSSAMLAIALYALISLAAT